MRSPGKLADFGACFLSQSEPIVHYRSSTKPAQASRMEKQILQVTDFHHHIGAAISQQPQLLNGQPTTAAQMAAELRSLIAKWADAEHAPDPLADRTLMSIEELAEWLEAHASHDLTAAADAWGDRCYLLIGDAIAAGLPAVQVFDAVHISNMTKARQMTRRGKAVKEGAFASPVIGLNNRREQ